MSWEDAVLKALEELNETHPEWATAYLVLMMRTGQILTESPHSNPPEDLL